MAFLPILRGLFTGSQSMMARDIEPVLVSPSRDVKAELTTSKELEDVLIARGMESFAGVNVTPQVAMMVSAVSAATSLLSETAAMLPLMIYRRRADGGKERAADHPLYRLLHEKPNGWQDSFQFLEFVTLHLLLNGNGYAIKVRRKTGPLRGQVLELLPVHSDRVKVDQRGDYSLEYRIALADGATLIAPQSEVFHIRDRSLNGYEGASRLKSGRDAIGLARVTERWGAQLFGNGARPSGILTTDGTLDEQQVARLRDSWKAAHGGENALGTAVLDGGLKWQALAMTSEDSQFLETRKHQIAEIARIYRVPPHMLADLERATFSNIEHQSLEFVKYSLMPWLRRWESAINTQLLEPGGEYFAEFVVDGLLRGDTKSRYEAYASALQNEWMNKNEVRALENLNPVEGGEEFRNPAINPKDGGPDEPAQTPEDQGV